MRFLSIVLTFLTALVTLTAGLPRDSASLLYSRHARLANRTEFSTLLKKRSKKRCANRPTQTAHINNNVAESTTHTSSSKAHTSTGKADANNGVSAVINVNSNSCGPSGATGKTTATSGPNGSLDWLNCGIGNGGGWSPPHIRMEDIITKDLASAIKEKNSPFHACSNFVWIFEKYGNMYNIPPIMLASFAMQESSCNPNTVGGGGEQGLMQITRDKCGGAPNGDCKEPEFNIRTAAKFFNDLLQSNDGNVLLCIGHYNGWHKGLTFNDATAAAYGKCCRCQNNLDYLHQFLNGWVLNINAYDFVPRLGKYFNLDKC